MVTTARKPFVYMETVEWRGHISIDEAKKLLRPNVLFTNGFLALMAYKGLNGLESAWSSMMPRAMAQRLVDQAVDYHLRLGEYVSAERYAFHSTQVSDRKYAVIRIWAMQQHNSVCVEMGRPVVLDADWPTAVEDRDLVLLARD